MSSIHLPRTGLMPQIVRALLSDPAPRAPAAAEVLGSLLDLRGSVDLAEVLAAAPLVAEVDAPEPPVPPASRSTGADAVRARLADIEARMARRFASPLADRPRIPDATAMHASLVDAGIVAGSGKPDTRAVVRSWAAAFRDRLVASVDRVLGELAVLREEVAADLCRVGRDAARLEAIDRALRDATDRGVSRLIERLAAATERAAAADLSSALKQLPHAADVPHLSPWFVHGGCVRGHLDRIEGVTRALFAHERAVLDALVTAAWGEAA